MSFELPLTALAMEIAGTAARAVGACQTLTFPQSAVQSDTEELLQAAVDASHRALGTVTASIRMTAPPTLTVTL